MRRESGVPRTLLPAKTSCGCPSPASTLALIDDGVERAPDRFGLYLLPPGPYGPSSG